MPLGWRRERRPLPLPLHRTQSPYSPPCPATAPGLQRGGRAMGGAFAANLLGGNWGAAAQQSGICKGQGVALPEAPEAEGPAAVVAEEAVPRATTALPPPTDGPAAALAGAFLGMPPVLELTLASSQHTLPRRGGGDGGRGLWWVELKGWPQG